MLGGGKSALKMPANVSASAFARWAWAAAVVTALTDMAEAEPTAATDVAASAAAAAILADFLPDLIEKNFSRVRA